MEKIKKIKRFSGTILDGSLWTQILVFQQKSLHALNEIFVAFSFSKKQRVFFVTQSFRYAKDNKAGIMLK